MSVKRVANRDCRFMVERQLPFEGSNLAGYWHHRSNELETPPRCYVVESYRWYPLYIWEQTDPGGRGQWFRNAERRYSQSTQRQKAQAEPRLGCEQSFVDLSPHDMQVVKVVGYARMVQGRLQGSPWQPHVTIEDALQRRADRLSANLKVAP